MTNPIQFRNQTIERLERKNKVLETFVRKVAESLDDGGRYNGYNAFDILWDLRNEAAVLAAAVSPAEGVGEAGK